MVKFITSLYKVNLNPYIFHNPNAIKNFWDHVPRFNNESLQIQDLQVIIVIEAIKKGAWHKRFFDSLEKSLL